jgi:hypothetical protein
MQQLSSSSSILAHSSSSSSNNQAKTVHTAATPVAVILVPLVVHQLVLQQGLEAAICSAMPDEDET